MSARATRKPLTREQQATVTKWLPLACKYTLWGLIQRGLRHYEDEAEGLAADALLDAVRVWLPERGPFPACLKWWVWSTLNRFSAHGARTVHQPERADEYVDAWSLDVPLARRSGYSTAANAGLSNESATWGEMLVDETLGDPSEPVDAGRLSRAVPLILARRIAATIPRADALDSARQSVRLWYAREVDDDVTLDELAKQMGISRQAVQQRTARVQDVFERWAREVRDEAA